MSTNSSFSLAKALSAAGRFVPEAWGGAWLVLILAWLPPIVGMHLMSLHVFGARPLTFAPIVLTAINLVSFIVKLMAMGGLYRLALFARQAKTEGLGFGGVQFGKPEWRLLGAKIVVAAFILLIVATLVIVFAVAFSLSGQAAGYDNTLKALQASLLRHSTPADFIFIAYLVAAWIFLIFVGIKFSLMSAATIAEHRMVTLNALGLSTGNVGKLFIGLLLIVLPFAVIGIVMSHHTHMAHVTGFASGFKDRSHLGFAVYAIIQAMGVGLVLPLMVGFLASAYRQIVDSRSK